MNPKATPAQVKAAEAILGHHFTCRRYIESALTHPSATEGMPVSECYERLEFLGDSILGAIVAEELFERYPSLDEGALSRLKTSLVSGETLSAVAEDLGVGPCIAFGASEKSKSARGMHSALENVYEALVGALYLDAGIQKTREFVLSTLENRIDNHEAQAPTNPKSALQELVQRTLKCAPEYVVVGQEGPAHDPSFTVVVKVQGIRVGRGSGSSKKHASAQAAADALERLTKGRDDGVLCGSVLAHDFDEEGTCTSSH